jgi:hypothetical protein
MKFNRKKAINLLDKLEFQDLFIEELGWNYCQTDTLNLKVNDSLFQLEAIAEKKGIIVYLCHAKNGQLPDYNTRKKIDTEITNYSQEHLIIYTDKKEQIWQWVRREIGKPLAIREYRYHLKQTGESLIQKLEELYISFEAEENLTLYEVTKRTKKAFDLDKITKKFYDQFQKEHTKFLRFITIISQNFDKNWYTYLMLNRLMFVYFLQKKGFLNSDINYLRNKLSEIKTIVKMK